MEHDNQAVQLDFTRLDMILLDHAMAYDANRTEYGERNLSMSVFTEPLDFDSWPNRHRNFTHENIEQTRNRGFTHENTEQTRKGIFARNSFIRSTVDAGYSDACLSRVLIKPWMLDKLIGNTGSYREKCAGTSIAFMLGQSLANSPDDLQCIITGDADLIPPVVLNNSKHTKNLILATTRPDEAKVEHRQSSFAFNECKFRIPPVYLQDNLLEIVNVEYVSECSRCQRVFSRSCSPPNHLPCCAPCYDSKLYNRQPYSARCV